MQALGCLPFALGVLLLAAGSLYLYEGYRFGFAICFPLFVWGLAGIGVGLVMFGTIARRWAVPGVLTCMLSLALTAYLWPYDKEWIWGFVVPNVLGIVYGLVAIVAKTRSRHVASAATTTS